MYVCLNVCIYVYMYGVYVYCACMHVRMYVSMYAFVVCMYACMYVSIYLCINVCMYHVCSRCIKPILTAEFSFVAIIIAVISLIASEILVDTSPV